MVIGGNFIKKLKIVVYAICKNEEQFVDRWYNSMQEADEIVVTDTGSTDNTIKKLREKGAVVYEEKVYPWRFDVARNLSLRNVPSDADICVCTDLDEVFDKGWRNKLEESWDENITQGNYLFNWSFRSDGRPNGQFHGFKIHTRHDYKWEYPIHECLRYIGTAPEVKKFIEGVVLNHHPDNTKSRESYLDLLEFAVKENPNNDRMHYYLGREYMYKEEWISCITTLSDYLKLPSAIWDVERCAAMRWIAHSYVKLKKYQDAYKWYFKAIAECIDMRDAYIEFARLAYELEDWNLVLYLTEAALKIKEQKSYINMGYAWDHTPYDLLSIAAYNLNLFDKSFENAKKALELDPNNERLANNLIIIKNKKLSLK